MTALLLAWKLVWNPNPVHEGVTNYNIYCSGSVSGVFTNYGSTPTNEFPLTLVPTGQHFFYVTAVNSNGVESAPR